MAVHNKSFVSTHWYDAIYETPVEQISIIFEERIQADRSSLIFTRLNDGREIRASSIPDLVITNIDCISLSIKHEISVWWNGKTEKGQLEETFARSQEDSSNTSVTLVLNVRAGQYTTTACESFTEAMFELHNITPQEISWRLQTCFDCKFSYPAFTDPTSDRDELQCHRDAPLAFQEVQTKGKYASLAALHAGDYFVNAFHTCAAWELIQSRS
ncbi:MAG: hypothetical protein KF726_22320 [Anaerolineae bacterium]|nr:hypothetical protein [Anaerolineae bacterium]